MLSYFGYGLLVALISVVVGIVAGTVVGLLLSIAGSPVFVAVVTGLVVGFLVLVVNYRLSAILPAAALGQKITLQAAWEATAGASGQIIVLAFVSALAAFAIDLPALLFTYLGGAGGVLADLWFLATGWLKVMVGVSILTTLYGHFIEKRALPS